MKILACAATLFAFSGASMAQQSFTKPLVVNIMNAESQAVGTATLSPAASGVKIVLDIKKLPPGEHSIHIHQMAKCDPPDFKSAGPHFNATGHMHDSAPAGDIPDFSLIVGKDGTAHVSTIAPNVTLATQVGRTFDLFNWAGVAPTGAFIVSSPYTWNLSQLYTTGEVTLNDGTRLNAKALKDLKDGEVVHVNLPGGGGYGEPWKRDVEKVRWDVVENYISVEEAEQQRQSLARQEGREGQGPRGEG